MKKNEDGGSIVNVSSMRARQATGDHLLYGASMAGVSAMSRELEPPICGATASRMQHRCSWDVFTANDPRMKDGDFVKNR